MKHVIVHKLNELSSLILWDITFIVTTERALLWETFFPTIIDRLQDKKGVLTICEIFQRNAIRGSSDISR